MTDAEAMRKLFPPNVLKETTQEMIQEVKNQHMEFRSEAEKKYVTHEQFEPIKMIVYGTVSVILLSVFGALIAMVIKGV